MRPHTILLPQENLVGTAEGVLIPAVETAHFYCPMCGETWAHALPGQDAPTPTHHKYRELRCPAHGNGTLLLHFNLASLSEPFLRREVLLRRRPLLDNCGLPYTSLNLNEP
jgi:hypothetical protein